MSTTKRYQKTIYQVSYGCNGQERIDRYFAPWRLPDALLYFSKWVVTLDRDTAIGAAWVNIGQLPDSIHMEGRGIAHWTKVSNEGPVSDGYQTLDEALTDD
jgi:hypothetical protein